MKKDTTDTDTKTPAAAPQSAAPKMTDRTKQLVDHLAAHPAEQRPRILAQYKANGVSESELAACERELGEKN